MTSTGWRPTELVTEAIDNVLARPWSAVIAFALVLLLCLTASSFEIIDGNSAVNSNAKLIAAGYTTLKVSPAHSGATMPATPCERMQGHQGVVAAGGVGTPTTEQTSSDPGDYFDVASSVGNISTVLSGTDLGIPPEGGYIVSTALATELGVEVGSHLDLGGRIAPVSQVAALGARDEFLGRIVLTPTLPTGAIAACYVQFEPGDFTQGLNAVSALYAQTPNLTFEALAAHDATTVDPAATLAHRPSRFGWLVAGVAIGVMLAYLARSRRHERAVYMLTGSTRAEVATLSQIEIGIVLWLGVVSSLMWAAALAVATGASWQAYRLGAVASVRSGLLAACIVPIGLVWMLRNNLTTALRQRNS